MRIAGRSRWILALAWETFWRGSRSGSVREPRRYLAVGETIRSEIESIGRLSNRYIGSK